MRGRFIVGLLIFTLIIFIIVLPLAIISLSREYLIQKNVGEVNDFFNKHLLTYQEEHNIENFSIEKLNRQWKLYKRNLIKTDTFLGFIEEDSQIYLAALILCSLFVLALWFAKKILSLHVETNNHEVFDLENYVTEVEELVAVTEEHHEDSQVKKLAHYLEQLDIDLFLEKHRNVINEIRKLAAVVKPGKPQMLRFKLKNNAAFGLTMYRNQPGEEYSFNFRYLIILDDALKQRLVVNISLPTRTFELRLFTADHTYWKYAGFAESLEVNIRKNSTHKHLTSLGPTSKYPKSLFESMFKLVRGLIVLFENQGLGVR